MTKRFGWLLSALCITCLLAADLWAQPGGGRGGFGGGRGGAGGERGGRGGGAGGERGGRGGFNPADFLRRLDTNNNNILEPSEIDDRTRGFIERIARDVPGINLNRPIPIDRLVQGFEQVRQQRAAQTEGGGGRGGTMAAAAVPLVPGFGVEVELPPVPGFGEQGDLFSVRVEPRDRQEAEERMRRYDRNRDGYLTPDELARGRWGDDDPMEFDRNRDGKISVDELAVRYANRRIRQEQAQSGQGAAGSEGRNSDNAQQTFYMPGRENSATGSGTRGRDGNRGGTGGEGESRMARIADMMLQRADTNGNGVLDRDEWSNLPGDLSEADKNNDGKIDRNELIAWMETRNFGGGWGGRGGGGSEGGRGGGGSPGGFFGRSGGDRGGGDRSGGFFGRGGGERGGGERGGGERGGGDRGGGFFGRSGGERGGDNASRGRDGGRGRDSRNASQEPARSFFAPGSDSSSDARQANRGNRDNRDEESEDQPVGRTAYRSLTPWERLELEGLDKGLPDWFASNDLNEDGQISMSEFSSTWDESVLADFEKFDLNGDGVITAKECLAAVKKGAVRGISSSRGSLSSRSGSSSSTTSTRGTTPTSSRTASSGSSRSGGDTASEASGEEGEVPSKYMTFAVGTIRRYDTNKNGVLDGDEIAAVRNLPDGADADGDGIITPEELARAYMPEE
jgi:Ca2+-binding EF-hand superfamily protein